MDARIVEQITEWSSRPFSGGLETLHALADEEFSGAVKAGGAWLFMLNGRVIGVFDGSLDTFEESDGTQFEAPHPSLPLLFSMQERGGTTQAKYYTNDTPLKEASETLASNGFTGYIELSENVLSGDYYVVYHGGRSMSAAYVGQSEQLISGDEAFSRANDEVGIYEVVAADVDIIDLPEPETQEPEPTPEPAAPESDSIPAAEASDSDEQDGDEDQSSTPTAPSSAETAAAGQSEAAADARQPTSAPPTEPTSERNSGASEAATPSEGESDGDDGTGASDPLSDEQQWRETTRIPSLDPENSSSAKSRDAGVKQRRTQRQTSQRQSAGRQSAQQDTPRRGQSNRAKEIEAELTARAEKIEALRSKLTQTEAERDELKAERDRLTARVEELQDELETVRERSPGVSAERQLPAEQALTQTNLFVRYGSKGKGTLADAAAGEASRDTVESNLQLEHHTQFDTAGVAVDGREFEAFLHDSMEYTFVSWLVVDLLYEILETGHQRGLKDLFEAIQRIDRVELHGSLVTETEEDGTTELPFDVILRDRMGNPLVVANINDSRDPATGEMMGSLVDAATAVSSANDELSAAFQVTKSFFEPAALETTEDATSGGLLTREKRESFVKLSRKRGYHLCLVESRNGEFHLTVPEL
ncbi:hypothetical protein [Haladaptatus sp. DYF46]|uniref:DUF7527 domain-containing protein n=1 Tax=Haladaptatus sp. DYF46 TaxID=2886041 RepID=UPI001E5351BF|nr:hypothetical protein [Haladaptatus sp. DYF46]